jgi:hypothetical protein
MIELYTGQLDAARARIDELEQLTVLEGLVFHRSWVMALRAHVRRHTGEHHAAWADAAGALTSAVKLPAWSTAVEAFETLAGLAVDAGEYDKAGRLFGAGRHLRDDSGHELCLSTRDADSTHAQAVLGKERFVKLYEEGRSFSVDKAVDYVGLEGGSL